MSDWSAEVFLHPVAVAAAVSDVAARFRGGLNGRRGFGHKNLHRHGGKAGIEVKAVTESRQSCHSQVALDVK